MKFIEERNKLLLVKIYCQSDNQWRLVPRQKKDGSSIRKGDIIFRGSEEEFKKLLRKLKAKDHATSPASQKNTTYQQMVNTAKDKSDPYIWVELRHWNSYRADNKITTMENSEMRRVKENRTNYQLPIPDNGTWDKIQKEMNRQGAKLGKDYDLIGSNSFWVDYAYDSPELQDVLFNRKKESIYTDFVAGTEVEGFLARNINRMDDDTLIGILIDKFGFGFETAEDILYDYQNKRMRRESTFKVGDKVLVPGWDTDKGAFDDYGISSMAKVVAVNRDKVQIRYLDDGELLLVDTDEIKKFGEETNIKTIKVEKRFKVGDVILEKGDRIRILKKNQQKAPFDIKEININKG